MRQRLRERERSNAKGGARDRAPKDPADTPIERFRSLARRFVRVPKRELQEKEETHRTKRLGGTVPDESGGGC